MELAEKIKAARLEAGLSQRQLCADRITRNMLSQIENGTARPSMQTLQYLAQRLGRSVGYFLEEHPVDASNLACITQARKAFSQEDAAAARQCLQSVRLPDPILEEEYHLLWYLTGLQLARQALDNRQQPYAVTLLEQLAQTAGIYITPPLRLQRQQLLAEAGMPAGLQPDASLLLLWVHAALDQGNRQQATHLLAAAGEPADDAAALAYGNAAFRMEDYTLAMGWYQQAQAQYPEQAIPKLEICCRETGDYKRAYEYAKMQTAGGN